MKRITPKIAAQLREQHKKRLMDIAYHADCSPGTVRSYELGNPVKPAIVERIKAAYLKVCR